MKIDTARSTQSTFSQEPVTFDEESVGLMADILSGLYTNPNEAVVREYSANGLDGLRKAGKNPVEHPVQVTLPSAFEPFLVICDHGSGMSTQDAKSRFARYVSSDKRDSNAAIGGFGIGSLSCFAVADLVMVSTVLDGTKTDLSVIRTDKGPQITECNVTETAGGNGTTVTIPVDPHQDWLMHAHNALSFTGGRVTIDGEPTEDPRGDDAPMITGHRRGRGYGYEAGRRGDRLIMGGMNYRIPDSVIEKIREVVAPMPGNAPAAWLIEVPIGTVRLAYDRESIMDTKANAEALADYIEEHYVSELRERFVGETEWEAVRKMLSDEAEFIPAEAARQVRNVSQQMQGGVRSGTYVGFEIEGGKRRRIGDTHFSEVFSVMTRAKSVMFFPAEASRSPKIRRWLIDHDQAAGPAVAISVGDDASLAEVGRAGFTVMEAEDLRAYQPVIKPEPTSRSRTTGYLVMDPYTGQQTMMEPEEIAESYDGIVIGADYSHESWTYGQADRQMKLIASAWQDEKVAIVRTTTHQKAETAERRIGYDRRNTVIAHQSVTKRVWELITDDEKRLLGLIASGSTYRGRVGLPDAPRLPEAVLDNPKRVVSVAEELGQTVSVDLTEAKRVIGALEDPQTFDPLRERITQAGLANADFWLHETVHTWQSQLPHENLLGGEVDWIASRTHRIYDEENRRATIAGYLVLGLPTQS